MKNPLELYNQAVTLLEQAASFILQGNTHTAQRIINSLDVDTYEFCLDMYEQNDTNVDYYRSRFVFASLEFHKPPSKETIESYKANYFECKQANPHPKVVTILSQRYNIEQTELPLETTTKRPQPKPAKPVSPKSETKQAYPSAFQLGLFQLVAASSFAR